MKRITSFGQQFRQQSVKRLIVTLCMSFVLIALVLLIPTTHTAAQPERDDLPINNPPPALNPQTSGASFNPHVRQNSLDAPQRQQIQATEFQPQHRIQLGDASAPLSNPKSEDSVSRSSEATGLRQPYVSREQQSRALDGSGWELYAWEDFEDSFDTGVDCTGGFGNATWSVEDYASSGFYTWGQDDFNDGFSQTSVWPAAGGQDGFDPGDPLAGAVNYPDDIESWMVCGPFDFSQSADVYVDFYTWIQTEYEFDFLYFGASVDNLNFDVYYWTGNFGDEWLYEPFWMTNYAGYSDVYFAWIFESDVSNPVAYPGAWVDDITIWSYNAPTVDPNGDLIEDGSFENGGAGWWVWADVPATTQRTIENSSPHDPSAVWITDQTAVDGSHSAALFSDGSFDDFLFHPITIPVDATDIQFNFWFAVTTLEEDIGMDWACASLTGGDFFNFDFIVDLGCLDATYTTGYWQEVIYTLDDQEIAQAIEAGQVNLVFELYNRGATGTGTALWVDQVEFYVLGGDGGSHVDDNEPNDDPTEAITNSTAACDTTVSGTIGDILEGYGDEDWFYLPNVPTGRLDIDINAETQQPASELDSVVYLFDSALNFIDYNDDDGATFDSYLVYTNTTPNEDYYIAVVSYDGYGSADSFYDMNISCAGNGAGPPEGETGPTGNADTWTVMLYLNAEDPNFESLVQGYLKDLEGVVAGKTSFLNVVALYDGPADGDTVRYLIQPDGNYVNGVSQWPLTEQNMGDKDTLASFIDWAMDNYPAENYYLGIDDHGHGAYGVSWDVTNGNDSLTPAEVYEALKDGTNRGDRRIDIFDYEACLMGLAENAYDLREWADYVVFSEQINWGINTYPRYFSDLAGSDTPLQVGQRIINRYHFEANTKGYPHTWSLIDTSKMTAVKQASTNLANFLMTNSTPTAVNSARASAQAFAGDLDATNPAIADYMDLWDLADKLDSAGIIDTSLANQVKTAVDDAVVFHQDSSGYVDQFYWDNSNSHGLAIYYPAYNGSSIFNDYINERLYKMSENESGIDGTWDEFIAWAVTQTGNGASNGLGGDDRKGMPGLRFLQAKLDDNPNNTTSVYLPAVMRP